MAASIGAVTSISTFSGLAPISVVIINAYCKSMDGSKSVVIRIKETTPNTITRSTPTRTVYGFLTLNLDIIKVLLISLTDQSVSLSFYIILSKFMKSRGVYNI